MTVRHPLPRTRPARRGLRRPALAVALGVVVAPLLTVGGPAAPGFADEGCLSEAASGFGAQRCDDSNPPDAALTSSDPMTNAKGYISEKSITIGFAGSYTDADKDPIAFQCQLYDTAAAPEKWDTCQSPVTYNDLKETGETPYTFRVRAIDSADNSIDATSGGIFGPSGAETDVPDIDQTPAQASFFVDTVAPNTFVFDEPFDETTPDFPMIKTTGLHVSLESNERDAVFRCSLSGRSVPCQGGNTTIKGVAPGNQVLHVVAVDPAGNVDPTATSTPFSVPTNLGTQKSRGFKLVDKRGYFGGDYLEATRRGAQVVVRVAKANEMRVIAPVGPGLGKIEMQVGARAQWVTLPQSTTTSKSFSVIHQRFFGRTFTGRITFRALRASTTKPARIDAILLH